METPEASGQALERLHAIVVALRDPVSGCPWDRVQTARSLAPYTLEEAYEVVEAIETDDSDALADELGDLMFQVVLHAAIAEEQGRFDLATVIGTVAAKMERRHPHVFAGARRPGLHEQAQAWEDIKAEERRQAGAGDGQASGSALDGVARALPGLPRVVKLGRRAERARLPGFQPEDRNAALINAEGALQQLRELDGAGNTDAARAGIGALLFAVADLARRLQVEPEQALREQTRRVEQRLRAEEARRVASDSS